MDWGYYSFLAAQMIELKSVLLRHARIVCFWESVLLRCAWTLHFVEELANLFIMKLWNILWTRKYCFPVDNLLMSSLVNLLLIYFSQLANFFLEHFVFMSWMYACIWYFIDSALSLTLTEFKFPLSIIVTYGMPKLFDEWIATFNWISLLCHKKFNSKFKYFKPAGCNYVMSTLMTIW